MSSVDDPQAPQQVADESPVFPLSLKIVATSFLIVGILGLVDITLAALSGRVFVDLNVLALFIGRGLWRLSARARWWAMFVLWLTLPITVIAAVLIGIFVCDSIEEAAALLFIALFCGFLAWQLRLLMRSNIRQLFFDSELKKRLAGATASRRYQFSLASLFVAMLVVGLIATRLETFSNRFQREQIRSKFTVATRKGRPRSATHKHARSQHKENDDFEDVFGSESGTPCVDRPGYVFYDTSRMTAKTAGRLVFYGAGYREPESGGEKELLYIMLGSANGTFHVPTHSWASSSGSRGVRLSKPDGSQVELPEAGFRLYEFSEGRYRESDQRVTMRQFVGFIRSKPEEYTIDALLEFASEHPDGK